MRILVLTFVILLLFSNPVFAEEASFSATLSSTGNDIGVSKITPASPIYFLKTLRENLEMKLALTPHVKKIRQLEFATRRLREVRSLREVNRQDLIQPTLERYLSYLSKLDPQDLSDPEVVTRVKESLAVHLEVLEQIYTKITNKSAKIAIRSIVNRIVERVGVPLYARVPACYFLQKESTASSITEPERVILQERATKCLINK